MTFDPQIAISVLTGVATVAAAWGGTKVALNGTRDRVKNVEHDMVQHKSMNQKQHIETVERLTRIETKLDTQLAPLVMRRVSGAHVDPFSVDPFSAE